MTSLNLREYSAHARSSGTFGRVLCNTRNHHFVVDGPVQNGCPGEEVTPAELFLAAVACCGVELVEVLARAQNLPLTCVNVEIQGMMDRDHPVRPDVSLFNRVRLDFELSGVTQEQGLQLIESFKGR